MVKKQVNKINIINAINYQRLRKKQRRSFTIYSMKHLDTFNKILHFFGMMALGYLIAEFIKH